MRIPKDRDETKRSCFGAKRRSKGESEERLKEAPRQSGLCSDDGGVAQLGEHLPCKQGVSGSIPLISTKRDPSKISEFKNKPWAKIKAQRSGFDFERRSSKVTETSDKSGGEGYGACDDEGQ